MYAMLRCACRQIMYNKSRVNAQPRDTHTRTSNCSHVKSSRLIPRKRCIDGGRNAKREKRGGKNSGVIIVHEFPLQLTVITRTYSALSGLMTLRIHRLAEVRAVVVSTTGSFVVVVIIPLLVGKVVHSHALLEPGLLL